MKKEAREARDKLCSEIRELYKRLGVIETVPAHVVKGDAIHAAEWKDMVPVARQESHNATRKFFKGDMNMLLARKQKLEELVKIVL